MAENSTNRLSEANLRLARRVQLYGLVALVVGFIAYGFSGCPEKAAKLGELQFILVIPSDAHGKLEYCAFGTRVSRTARVPVEEPIENLCGPNKSEVMARASAYQKQAEQEGRTCFSRSVLGRLFRL
ncbi:hypothetical protein [Burkholderia ambifaria]|uniref:hypothetical protein n=1 Tax=Burkholderia ambifaria TaxID=152480 RepID=UPI000F806AD0|nr:hypothetical protein [Burkholderia ambifaria]